MSQDIDKQQAFATQGVQKSKFNGSFTHKHTQKMSDVVPNACVPIFPGDSFSGSVATAFNFPPLVAPAYQGFTQKAYMFRVRKGLLWHNDGIRNALNCLKTGESLTHPEPHVALSSGYYFGSNKYCIRFHPHIPVYGEMVGNVPVLHKHSSYDDTGTGFATPIPTNSVNAFLQHNYDDFLKQFTLSNVKTWFSQFVADGFSHGIDSGNPLYFAPTFNFRTIYGYQKGDECGCRYGFKAYYSDWDSAPDGTITHGNKTLVNDGTKITTGQIMTFYPFADVAPSAFVDPTSTFAEEDIVYSDTFTPERDDLLNPRALYNFACGYVSDGVGGPSTLMEYLGLPSFNYTPYMPDFKEHILDKFINTFYTAHLDSVPRIRDKYNQIKNDPDFGTEDFTKEEGNQIFNAFLSAEMDSISNSGCQTAWDVELRFGGRAHNQVYEGYPFFDSVTQPFDPAGGKGSTQWCFYSIYDLMHIYAIWCIENGYGDGTIPPDEECPVIYVRNLANILVAPVTDDTHTVVTNTSAPYPCQSLCPWLAYWTVYENYFRDPNISESLKPVLDIFKTANSTLSLDTAHNAMIRSASTDYITWFGEDYSTFASKKHANKLGYPIGNALIWSYKKILDDELEDLDCYTGLDGEKHARNPFWTLDNFGTFDDYKSFHQRCFFRLRCKKELIYPFRKLLDKDLFTNLLPTTSKVEVFAPSFSSSDLATLYDGKQMFAALDEELANSVGQKSAQPFKLTDTPSVTNYIDVDALRTAQILQRYYRDATLVGDQINEFIRLTFGERSQDFRPELPELIFAREFPCHISEITQQSETDQLPLGTEGGKMSSSSSAINFNIESHGDYGYFIYMTCIYPETENNNGLNHQFDVFFNQFEQQFVPRFATLGEEGLTALQVDCLPKADLDGLGKNNITSTASKADSTRIVGYVPRYSLFKRIPSYISGRFKGDMNYWTLDRIPNPFEPRMSLTHKYLQTPRDLRLFASDEEENCFGFTAFRMSFVRGVATNEYQPIL